MIALAAALLGLALSAGEEARLVRGDVIVNVARDPAGASGAVEAWIDIPGPAALVWTTMNDCAHAASFVPKLIRCTIIEADPKGAWEIREHLTDPGWILPNVRSRFRSDYVLEREIRFAQIDGDFDVMEGTWTLTPRDQGQNTRLRYQARIKPSFWAPEFVVRGIVESDAPEVLRALRAEVVRHMAAN